MQALAQDEFQAGLDAYRRGDFKTAFQKFRTLSEKGEKKAQFNLAVMYDNGQGVPTHFEEEVKWYKKAAEQGMTEAQISLDAMYDEGKESAARRWRRELL